jgi:hypothetical protein
MSKELGKLFDAGTANVTVPERIVTIGAISISGTLAVKVDGDQIDFSSSGGDTNYSLQAYSDANYMNQIGSVRPTGATGAWTMSIPDTYKDKLVYFMLSQDGNGASYKLGSETATATGTIAIDKTFTTKAITGTVKNGATAIEVSLMLFEDTADTFDALIDKWQSGEIAQITSAGSDGDGKWTVTVLSDVASAYILVYDEAMNGYITSSKISLTAGTPIALDIATMKFIGVYSGNG